MANFITRVVLHDAEPNEYTKVLHPAMEKRGFTRTIKGKKGVYDLPDAEYHFGGDVTIDQVLELAKAGAAVTKKTYQVLVTEAVDIRWAGLDLTAK